MATTRRTFLKVIGSAGAVGACGLPLACGPGVTGPVEAGNVADLAEGDIAKVEDSAVLVARDAGGIYAMTAICTHAGCDMSGANGTIDGGTIRCGCHGSVFKADGSVETGPAGSPLQHWKVEVAEDGAITVQVGTEAADDERVAVS
jgi:Rieske Fe-S protein